METRIHQVEKIKANAPELCKICSKNSVNEFSIEQSYFVLVFMPMFPVKRTIYKVCPECGSRLKVKPNSPDLKWVNKAVPKKFNLGYYWGIFVLAGLIFLAWYWYSSVMAFNP